MAMDKQCPDYVEDVLDRIHDNFERMVNGVNVRKAFVEIEVDMMILKVFAQDEYNEHPI